MLSRALLFRAAVLFALIVLTPRSAFARQQGPSDSLTSGVSPSLQLPSSLFLTDKTRLDDEFEHRPLGGISFAERTTPAWALSTTEDPTTFQPAKLTRVVWYGLQLTFYEHVMRIATQSFTRKELKGKFWPDYVNSLHVPKQWGDKDHWQVNYIGHAISGGAFTRIWMEQRERRDLTKSQYLKAIGRATIFAAIFSVQYEMGPMSEASIGNVGLNPKDLGWTDYVWTPIGGALWTMAEDAIDKYALTFIDKHVIFLTARAAGRLILNPSRMLANVGMNRSPWNRPDRDINGKPYR